jgi:ATP-binding cassette subfamily C protein LapB
VNFAFLQECARRTGQSIGRGRQEEVDAALAGAGGSAAQRFATGWQAAELDGKPRPLPSPEQSDLPFVAHGSQGWLLIAGRAGDGAWTGRNEAGDALRLASLDGLEFVGLPPKSASGPRPVAAGLVWEAILRRKAIFFEAVVASLLVNLLTLAVSLYSMQVYDRVIPQQGYQTLWVLTVGVAVALILEFFLKHVRATTIDRVSHAIDRELSDWFFRRALGIRMEARPKAVGTFAAQLKGLELVRNAMTSSSVFVLVDVPFALLFIAVIALVGGPLALVPLCVLPVSLFAGLAFQRAIARNAKEHLDQSNRKSGLLVEAIDGVESIKASSAEWRMQGGWNTLVTQAGESDLRSRRLTVMAQNLTLVLQQLGFVAVVATGAYLVTQNELTMGGLLACSIIANRAFAPIAQLPSMLVQWAHAGSVLTGLDAVIALPNEIDERESNLVPDALGCDLRLDRVRFAYDERPVLEVGQLQVRAGERIAVLGAVGSGKSTLLKVISGLYRPAEGKLFIGGVDMSLVAPAVLRETAAYLPQDIRLFSGTLRDNLLLGLPDPGDEAILQAAQRSGLAELVAAQPKGLALPITEGGRGVSGGQRQLIGLTRLLLAKPRLWLLDEPTASMDTGSEQRVAALIREAGEAGATIIISTHKTALLPLFERIIILQQGRIVADGPRDAVMAKLVAQAKASTRPAEAA